MAVFTNFVGFVIIRLCISKYSNNHLVSKYLVFEEMLSDPMLDIDTKNKLTRQYLKGVFGGLSESLNIEEIMNQPSRNMVNAAISELVNKGISSEEIMKAMAQNLGEYYKKYGITINEELMKHIFTFDASRGQNGGFHYNTALANIKLERIGDGKFKLYTEDENGNKLYFKDTTGLEETEIVKSLWDDNTYSIVDIIDMAVNAYYSLRINETEIRGNGNYAYEFTLPNGEKSRAIFDGNGVLITVF